MRTYRLPLLSCLFLAAATADAATLVVTSAADTGGTTCGSVCTLRQAINVANATTAADTIHFAIAVPIRGEILITPATPLPTITQPLTINGYSQSGTRINDDTSFSNAVLRIRLSGQAQGASSSGLRVCAPDVTLQGLSITDFGVAVRIGNTGTGDCLATNTRVLGNFIGLTSSGVTVAGNDTGIFARTASIIGDASNGHRNVFAGGNSIILSGQITNGSSINGNLFGLTRGGADVTGGIVAIATGQSASNIVIGGLSPNTIRNYQRGFSVESTSRGIDLANNRISASGILGIDLGGDGFTPNDVDDIDSGANDRQNFPEITAANRVPGGLALSGLLDIGHPGGLVYSLTTYASPACHPGGHGDGARILGQTNRTVSSTAESFNYTQATTDPLPPGTVITMTATRAGVGTSEFSACFALDPPPLVVNAQDDVADGICNAAHCSLRDAIIVANGAPAGSARSIHFAIPPLTGTSEIVIAPNAPLPMITRTVTIDGYTQPGTAVNTDPSASNAVLRIRLDGANLSGLATGLVACADSVVSGLSITRFRAAAIANEGCPFGSGATVAGNFIGLATDGVTAGANGLGVNISNGPMRVGGTTPADRNLIAASTFSGVFVFAPFGLANGTSVLGNLIGTDRTGLLDRGNADRGVSVENAREVLVGSLDAPNLLAYNQYGVRALGDAQSTLAANRFVGNDALAIELGELGVNPNDPGDGDTGPNGLQNHPVLTLAERTDSGIRVVGSLDSPVTGPTDAKTIAVYASASCHSSGHGPGEQLLGVFPIVAPEFDQNLLTDVDLDQYAQITATATGAEGTSEMSACRLATDPAPGIAVDSAQDGAPNGGCDITGDGNPCTLREAILHANAASGSDVIRFAIPGDGPHVITLGSVLRSPHFFSPVAQVSRAPMAVAIAS
jgi:CSLREA domain-containing protein